MCTSTAAILAGTAFCLLAGCGGPKKALTTYRMPPAPAAPADLFAALQRQFRLHEALRAHVSLTFENLATGQRRNVGGRMRIARHKGIVLQAGKLGVTAFLMIANPDEFWIDVPRRNKTYESHAPAELPRFPKEKAFLNLRPSQIIDAVCLNPVRTAWTDGPWLTETGKDAHVLTAYRAGETLSAPGTITKRITLSSDDLSVERIELFDQEGTILEDIAYGDRTDFDGARFPARISMERPGDGVRLVLRLHNLQALDPDGMERPAFTVPAGRREVSLDRADLDGGDYIEALE